MELFKSGFRSVLGTQTQTCMPSGAETVERLIDRARSSTLLEDRRDACRALKALSRTYRMEVGAQGLDVMISVLQNDRSDSEILGYALDTLCNVTAKESFEEERAVSDLPLEELEELGERFTEIYLKKPENVSLILGLLEEYDFHVRWPAVKLLTHLIVNKPKDLQECILISPMGVSKFMDLLSDTREVIRNDALLLLFQLTKGNANIQKIVAFENAFDKLFDVILEEGHSDGGVVVEDCLHLLLNLMKNNPSNQTFFKEGSYIQKICPFFDISMPESDLPLGWPAQKVVNVQLMLQVLQSLVSPYRGAGCGEVQSCQQVMKTCGLVEKLCKLLMTPGVPADVLTEIIHTVGDMIRAHKPNQDYFAELLAPSSPPRKALVILLMSMVNDKQPFALRCAVLYVFECYLFRNDHGKGQVVQTLLPSSSAQVTSISIGQLLCSGLLSTVDSFAVWCSAVALSHTLVDSPQQREKLLRVHLAISHGGKPVPLLEQCSLILQQATRAQPRLGILMLLCQWLAHCPAAVSAFLALPPTVPFLISQVGSTDSDENEDLVQSACAFLMSLCILFNEDTGSATNRESLKMLISKRIGVEKFLDKLAVIGRHEVYAKVLKSPQLRYKTFLEPLLDHEFARLHKSYEGAVVTAVSGDSSKGGSNGLVDSTRADKLQVSVDQLTEENRQLKSQLDEARKVGPVPNGPSSRYPTAAATSSLFEGQLAELRQVNDRLVVELSVKDEIIERLQSTINERDATIASMSAGAAQNDLSQDAASHVLQLLDAERTRLSRATTELESLRRDQENMMDLLTEYETKISDYARRLKELGQEVDEDDLDDDLDVSEIESTVSDEHRRVNDTSALV